jgi:DNA mismatch repair protein MutL
MSDIIKLLPENVANQIAAGEVVQRPASVVKELIENAIDSGATSIKLFAKDSGKTLIQVTDNGKGMSQSDARLCFERHATSKITRSEDLFHIHTKGFRGEALSSIAAVAQVELKTRMPHDELGSQVVIEASQVTSQEPVQCNSGTSFFVKNLFYNVPARRYFLKSDAIELRHMIDEFQRVALAHPDIEFHFSHNGSEIFQLPATNQRQRIVHVFGNKYNDKLVPVEESTDIVSVQGFVGKPESAKKTRGEQFFFINQRFIKNTYLNHAVTSAFQNLIPSGVFPMYLLYLEINPDQIDINIHPTKTEIKFQDERSIYAIIHAAVRRALGKFNIAPSLDFDQETSIAIEPMRRDANITPPSIAVNTSFNPFGQSAPTVDRSMNLRGWFDRKSEQVSGWQELLEVATQIEKREEDAQTLLYAAEEDMTFTQHARKYVLCSSSQCLWVMDQQRAHQRILFEKFRENLVNGQGHSQQVLFPLELSLTPSQWAIFTTCADDIKSLGFHISGDQRDNLIVNGVPNECATAESGTVILELLDALEEHGKSAHERQEAMAWNMAARSSIKSGQMLTTPEMENLFQQLMRCSQPYYGRNEKPTLIQYENRKLDEYFK